MHKSCNAKFDDISCNYTLGYKIWLKNFSYMWSLTYTADYSFLLVVLPIKISANVQVNDVYPNLR